MVDNADKDKNNKIYDKNFSVKVFMTAVDEFKFEKQTLKHDKQKPGKKKWKQLDGKELESSEDEKGKGKANNEQTGQVKVPQVYISDFHAKLLQIA
jgi:hypothetical protein